MKIYNIFYPNLFQSASTNLRINQINKPLSLIIINNNKKCEIKDILNTKSY